MWSSFFQLINIHEIFLLFYLLSSVANSSRATFSARVLIFRWRNLCESRQICEYGSVQLKSHAEKLALRLSNKRAEHFLSLQLIITGENTFHACSLARAQWHKLLLFALSRGSQLNLHFRIWASSASAAALGRGAARRRPLLQNDECRRSTHFVTANNVFFRSSAAFCCCAQSVTRRYCTRHAVTQQLYLDIFLKRARKHKDEDDCWL